MNKKELKLQVVLGTLLKTNNWIVGDSECAVLIDCSAPLLKISEIIGTRKLLGVILTHGHWDHFQSINEIVNHYDCKVFLHQNAYQKLMFMSRGYAIKHIDIKLNSQSFVFVKNGDTITFDNLIFNVFETFGHTDCSISLQMRENLKVKTNLPLKIDVNEIYKKGALIGGSVLFTGDTLFDCSYGRVDLPTGNAESMKKSLNFLLSNFDDKTYVLSGHGNITTIKDCKKYFNVNI
ncbi:MAG: MBL fold metallo-hydrolase [Clostridia bacterium]